MRARTGSFSKLRASIRRSSAKLVQKLTGSPNGPTDADIGGYGGYVSAVVLLHSLQSLTWLFVNKYAA